MIANYRNILFSLIFILFGISINFAFAAKSSSDINYYVNIENNGKSNKLELEYFNNSRYIDIEKIPNNIINNSKYNSKNYAITSDDIKLQFLPGSFYYTYDNLEETKVIQMYMPTVAKNITNGKNVKSKLFIPFVSFMKSLDSAGLYDVSYENGKSGDVVKIKSKNTKNTFLVSFPKLNFIDNELGTKLADNPETIDSEFKEIDEEYWDEERIANLYAEGNNLENDLNDNELAESVSEIANKVFNSIKSIDKNNFAANTSPNTSSSGSGSGSRISRIMPRYNGPFIRRKSYTDPFPNIKITTENDNLKFKVTTDNDNNKKDVKSKKVKIKTKEVLENKEIDSEHNIEISNSSAAKSENKLENKSEIKSEIKQPKTTNSDYYLPQNLKRPGIDF